MTSLLRRVWVSAGPCAAVTFPVLVIWSAYLVTVRGWAGWVHDPDGLGGQLIVSLLVVLAATVVTCRRSAVALDPRDVLDRIESSTEEYCLVLRPPGRDGRVAVPNTRADGVVRRRAIPDLTLEQVVAIGARAARDLPTYTIVDQSHVLAPSGPAALRVAAPERPYVAGRLIARAHSIVLVLPPGPDVHPGLAGAVEQIVRAGRQHRVIMVLPPPDRDVHGHHTALQRAALLLATLRGTGRTHDVDSFTAYEYELQLGAGTVVIKCTRGRRVHAWTAPPVGTAADPRRAREVVAATSYVSALAEAITDTEHELRGLDFAVRYPR